MQNKLLKLKGFLLLLFCTVIHYAASAQVPDPVETDTLAPYVTTVTTVSDVTASSAMVGGNVTSNGGATVTERGVVYSSTNTVPTIGDSKLIIGSGNGVYSQTIAGLRGGTTYYVRAYATNIIGTSYGTAASFTTISVAPFVTTSEIAAVSGTGATVGGDVSFSGGAPVTERGVVYSTSNATPTVSDTKVQIGTGSGTFSQTLTGLTPGTHYYLRAYAINAVGTTYGSIASFTTGGATVTSNTASAITTNSVTLGGDVTSIGTSSVTDRGVVLMEGAGIPTLSDRQFSMGSGFGAFSQSIASLKPATTYSVRAYATNSTATNYGGVQTFTTKTTLLSVNTTGQVITNAIVVNYAVTFEHIITGLTPDNFSVTSTGTINNPYVTAVTGSGTSWNVTAYTGTGEGLLTLNFVNDNGIVPGVNNAVPFAGQTFTIDRTPPTLFMVSIRSNNTDTAWATDGDSILVTLRANEALRTPVVMIAGQPATLTDLGGNLWRAGYLTKATDTEGIVPFSITITDLAGNSTATITTSTNGTQVTFNMAQPVVKINNPAAVCAPATVNLTTPAVTAGSDPLLTYRYYTDAAATIAVSDPAAITTGGTYYITGTNVGNHTSAPAAVTVTIVTFQKPVVSFTNDSYCINTPVNLISTSQITATGTVGYRWTDNNNHNATTAAAAFTYAATGSYNVQLKVFSQVCPAIADSVTRIITIATPTAAIRMPVMDVHVGEPTQLQARTFGATYNWLPANGLSNSAVANPVINANAEQQYLVNIKEASGCMTTDTLLVRIFNKRVYVPTVFSPNGDGRNDKLYINLINAKQLKRFRLFNRYGKMVFETSDVTTGWDGTYNGEKQPIDTYVWYVEGIDLNGILFTGQGTVTLLR